MTKLNFDRLKENVNRLMKERGLTQSVLAKELGMTQPNLNKCLSQKNDSRCFTLEQVCNLADYFEVTVDELLDRPKNKTQFSNSDICHVLATLISSNQVVHFNHKVEETFVYASDPSERFCSNEKTKDVTYDAFYFPDCYFIPDYIDYDDPRYDEVRSDLMYLGNENANNIAINNFLRRFIEAYEKYDGGNISEEEFTILRDAYYQILKNHQE